MSTPHDAESQVARINRLELQNRRLHFSVLGIVALAGGLGLIALSPRAPTVVQGQRFELVTTAGQRRAVIAADSSGFSVVLYGPRGQPTSGVALSDAAPRLVVLNGAGRVLASLGEPSTYPARP
jgi:hypothetical protein